MTSFLLPFGSFKEEDIVLAVVVGLALFFLLPFGSFKCPQVEVGVVGKPVALSTPFWEFREQD